MKCYCGGPGSFENCCGRIIAGAGKAMTASELMKSRYSAFCLRDADYLLASWDPETRPPTLELSDGREWLELELGATTDGGPLDSEGTVEFYASYRDAGNAAAKPGLLAEHSRFRRVDGEWKYRDGMFLQAPT